MIRFLRNSKEDLVLIIIILILATYLILNKYWNVSALTAPISIILGFRFWKVQELLKRRADSAEAMFKSFHLYAIQISKLDFTIMSKLKKINQDPTAEQIALLKKEYEKVVELKNSYLVDSNSFYRVANIPKDIQNKINIKMEPFYIIGHEVEEILNNPTKEKLTKNMPRFPQIGYTEVAGDAIKELIEPFVRFK